MSSQLIDRRTALLVSVELADDDGTFHAEFPVIIAAADRDALERELRELAARYGARYLECLRSGTLEAVDGSESEPAGDAPASP